MIPVGENIRPVCHLGRCDAVLAIRTVLAASPFHGEGPDCATPEPARRYGACSA